MEYITTKEATTTSPAERVAIPDVVVAGSIDRDLVARYVSASDSQRKAIEAEAIARVTPPEAVPSAQLNLAADDED